MSVVDPEAVPEGLFSRVKAILLRPEETWDVIDAEPATIRDLYKSYVAPLAAIPAVCGAIGGMTSGVGLFGFSWHPSIGIAVGQAVTGFLLTLAEVYVLAWVIDAIAPRFGGQRDRLQAFKLAAYSSTPVWVAGVFELIPTLGGLIGLIAVIYSLRILYLGMPKLMKSPYERALSFFAVVLLCVIVVGAACAALVTAVGDLGGPMVTAKSEETTVVIPGDHSIDLGKIEDTAKAVHDGKGGKLADLETLKGYLPAAVAGYARGEVSAGKTKEDGIKAATVKATYVKGPAQLTLKVADMGGAGRLAALAGAFNIKSSKHSEDRYEKIGKVDGRMTQESFNKASGHGEYSVVVGDRFLVHASGDGANMEDLKAAVQSVDAAKLETLAEAS